MTLIKPGDLCHNYIVVSVDPGYPRELMQDVILISGTWLAPGFGPVGQSIGYVRPFMLTREHIKTCIWCRELRKELGL
jgi:hypothetical protein